jgi:hypothetical protein
VGRTLPRHDQSAGKRRSGRTRKASKWLGIGLKGAALAAIPSKNTYLAAQYQCLKARLGHGRALGAVKHSILIAYWHMFTGGEVYRDLGGDYFQRRDPPARPTTRRQAPSTRAHRHPATAGGNVIPGANEHFPSGTSASLSDSSSCPPEEQDLLSAIDHQVRQIQHYNPDIVFAVGYPPDAIAVVQTMKHRGYVPPALLAYGSGYLDDTFVKGVKAGNSACGLPAADPAGIITHAAWASNISDQSKTAQRIAELFAQRYKRPMTSRAAIGFTTMLALAEAINNAGSTDSKRP